MTERTKLITCEECDGYGFFEFSHAHGAHLFGDAQRQRCTACYGAGEVSQLMTEEEIAQAKHDRDEADRESWMHDAYDREGDR